MLFTQMTFLVFLAVVLIGNLLTRRWRLANNSFLLIASWAFFVYWSVTDFIIFIAILSVNFVFLKGIQHAARQQVRGWLFLCALIVSLGALAFFKYRLFLGDNVVEFLNLLGLAYRPPSQSITIPLAISFYTFHLISLMTDVYMEKYPAPGFLDYCLYLSFFPQILAGPIVRGDQMLPQLQTAPRQRPVNLPNGIYSFCLGFFFKAAIADNIALVIDHYWTQAGLRHLSTIDAWCVILLYSAQIFADFGGYSFMAIGLGRLFAIELPENFNAPYLSTSFQEFWQRWHITLSTFLRDYLFLPSCLATWLPFARGSSRRIQFSLVTTMLLGGLWHGPAWTYVLWGGIHGVGLALERRIGLTMHNRRPWVERAIWCVFVQLSIIVAWVLFRSPNLTFAVGFLNRMFVLDGHSLNLTLEPRLAVAMALIIPVALHHMVRASAPLARMTEPLAVRGALAGVFAYLSLVFLSAPQGFIYFVF